MAKTPHKVLHGFPASPGLGHGPAFLHDRRRPPVEELRIPAGRIDGEIARFDKAVEDTRTQLKRTQSMVISKIDKAHAAIFEAQEMLLDDPLLVDSCRQEIRKRKRNAEFILQEVVARIRSRFEGIDASHLSIQNLDVLDVASRIRENLTSEAHPPIEKLSRDAVVVAHDLRPSDTARLNARHVLGIVTEIGGPTSHSAILAKALKIPAVVGVEGILRDLRLDDAVVVDGQTGNVTVSPTRQDLEWLRQRRLHLKVQDESLQKLRDLPCETRDGYFIHLAANLELPSEAPDVRQSGARGIGLFRSEFFYIGRGYIPSEEEQFQVYRDVVEQVAPMPVICRTLDLGGDKFITQPGMETGGIDTCLGLRAIRLCLANPSILRSQLRAILRASAFGKVKVMFPFITDVSEVLKAREILRGVQRDLDHRGVEHDPDVEVGIMIETPAAALTATTLAREVDFFSLGTNDLIQYTMAVDRVNESVAHLYNPAHPAVVRLIQLTVDAAHKAGIWVGVCGEMAGDPAFAVLLLGLGVDELSMSAVAIPEVKRVIRSLTLDEVRKLRQDVLVGLDKGRAEKVLARFRKKHLKQMEAQA